MAPSAPQQRQDPLHALCTLAGATDVESYLGLPPGASTRQALASLERKRRELEAALVTPRQDPARAREAELFLDTYPLLRARLGRAAPVRPPNAPEAPDYYAALGVHPESSYADIERAWRRLQAEGRGTEPLLAQAWRVLGDPLNRAHYDRVRREQATAESATAPKADAPAPPTPEVTAELGGPEVHEVLLEGDLPAVVAVPIVVRGRSRWDATLTTDHACLSTQPERRVSLAPGRHSLVVRIDPRKVPGRVLTATVTLASPHEQHVAVLRIRRPEPERRSLRGLAGAALAALAAVVLVALAAVGARSTVLSVFQQPSTVGDIHQLPTASACFAPGYAPLPRHVDVHIDGLGRPTGFTFGGVTSPEAEACVRQALAHVQFPATRDGLPAFHRYQVAPSPDVP